MTHPIRPIDESEWPAFSDVLAEAFNWSPHPRQAERWKAQTEFDRTLAAFDGDTMVASTSVYSFTMTVPGARLPVAGVTAVAVLPSHRRRGILSALMRRQLADVRERGEAVAALYASEAPIYGRYGYGRAAGLMSFKIPRHGGAFVRGAPADPSLRLRVVRPAEARAEYERLFASVADSRPGLYDRSPAFWDSVLGDEEFDQSGLGPLRSLLAEDGDGVRGYALFRVKSGWDDSGMPDCELRLQELFAADPAAYALLWRGVLDRDLVTKVLAYGRPVDDPLFALIADQRQLHATWSDELWVRLVQVDRALEGRAYAAPVDLVLEVADATCPWNAGRWRLRADTAGAECKQVDESPDVTLDVAALGSAYLGEGALATMHAAGLVGERTPGAVRALATAMGWQPKPWSGLIF
ncbi:GNAT family N-acetyltransferase [Nonomuraea sp. MCN248]|uniref:GNAT family N-acetyltransferase n=1 Tax=Nonomuraea corallina TaxID=2989783 RepID=A0ABT4SEV2_9ACTN|nr:GNAT family N-acetyltransferase [Nonomuraea corallina]MDA0635736.1 GNAT family N-acetyltransferase [Nonomuraea corallina]